VLTAPTVFEHDDTEGLVSIVDEDPPPEDARDLKLAQELCPARAIRIEPNTAV
jgi:ferredoxin